MYELRNWIISVLSLIRLFNSYYFNMLKLNLCYILWDLNLTIENSPSSFSSKFRSRFSNGNNFRTPSKSIVLSRVNDLNLSLAWPMKKKYLLQFTVFLVCENGDQRWTQWKSIFYQEDYSIYVKNLRLLQIWIISILVQFKAQNGKDISILKYNLCNILYQLNTLLNHEQICSQRNEYPPGVRKNLLNSTVYLVNSSNKKELMFHQVQLHKTIRKTVRKNYDKPGYLYIQMQLCQRESFENWLQSHSETRDYDEIMKIFVQIIDAIDYVHSSGLMHRDLKPSNIYFSKDGSIKIGDFGLATRFGVHQESIDITLTDDMSSHTYGIGTPTYLSPEQYCKKVYNSKTDMYSLGLIFYELLLPMKTSFEKHQKLHSARRHMFPLQFVHQYPKECELIRKLLSYDPDQRPSANDLKRHPLFEPYLYQLKN